MRILNPDWGGGLDPKLDRFFEIVRGADERILLLDYDGTLAPFTIERDEAAPYPGVREALDRIMDSGTTRLVVISGRPIAELLPLMGLRETPEVWGAHGWERLAPGEREPEVGRWPAAAEEGLRRGEAWADREGLKDRIECKTGCLAIHWRGERPDAMERLQIKARIAWAPIAEEAGLVLNRFDGGLELRVPGRGKGFAVRTVLSEIGPRGAAAYMGDDLTDEDAFAAMKGKGLSFLVRKDLRETEADVWIVPPGESLDVLERWLHSSTHP